MVGIIKDKQLKLSNGYHFLNNISLSIDTNERYKNEYDSLGEIIKYYSDITDSLDEKYKSILKTQTKEHEFNTGRYGGIFHYFYIWGFFLDLNEDSTYEYKFFNSVLSTGKWEKNKNKIDLFDSLLNKKYTLLVTNDNELTVFRLPMLNTSGFANTKLLLRK